MRKNGLTNPYLLKSSKQKLKWAMRTFLILPLVFGALLLIPSFGAVYGGPVIIIPSSAITTWVGTGDGQNWSDPLNWNRQVGDVLPDTLPIFNHELPGPCDLVIIDDDTMAFSVYFDITFFRLANEMHIGSDDTLVINSGRTFDHTPDACLILNEFAETIVNDGKFKVFGNFINNGAFFNNGVVLDCGNISGSFLPLPGIVNRCPVGGELIPLDTTMVLVAGTQTAAAWMIPVIVSGIGIAIVIARKF